MASRTKKEAAPRGAKPKAAKAAAPAAKRAKAEAAPKAAKPAKAVRGAAGGPTLVVVESPAKAKTIKKYLGRGFDVKASVGHVKDLPKSRDGVDVEAGFVPTYEVIKGKAKVLSDIKRSARSASRVLLATDPDREGEAIAWHIADELGAEGGDERVRRVLFNEITKGAIQKAIEHPIDLDRSKFESQQARRILDRLVGYKISNILWDKVRRGLSAGRVQSVAVRLVVEREREILAFVAEEYWSVEADLSAALPPGFRAKLSRVAGKKAELTKAVAEPLGLTPETLTKGIVARLEGASFAVESVERKERRRNAPPPFTTAKLQQESSNRLGFSAKKTMTLAQRLYEGVELGDEGSVGLITYMRTDSVRLSSEAIDAVRVHIREAYGADHLPEGPNLYRTKQKAAQEAHEAVRPTSLEWTPDRVRPFLEAIGERDMARLYELIWNRFVACQMVPAVYDQTTADIVATEREGSAVARAGAEGGGTGWSCTFRATGSILKFPGYLAVYGAKPPEEEAGAEPEAAPEEPRDGAEKADKGDRPLPPLEAGMALTLRGLLPEQHFTTPPPRFNDASLVKEMEEKGIGRPSTYAAILDTIQEKGYVEKLERVFKPTELGFLVTDWLVKGFPREMDATFTAGMEERLDLIEEGTAQWQEVLRGFWSTFEEDLKKAKGIPGVKGESKPTDITCEKCGQHKMVIKFGRNGSFLACPGYPECKNTMNFREETETDASGAVVKRIVPVKEEEVVVTEPCPKCGATMVMKRGRFGRFIACSRYPECDGKRSVSIGVTCPKGCGGYLTEKRSRFGRNFYGCSNWKRDGGCDFVSWDRPRNEACPTCGSAYLVDKYSKRDGPYIACPNKECDYRRAPENAPPTPGAEPGGPDRGA
jgi:DNA topoisomerase-1